MGTFYIPELNSLLRLSYQDKFFFLQTIKEQYIHTGKYNTKREEIYSYASLLINFLNLLPGKLSMG